MTRPARARIQYVGILLALVALTLLVWSRFGFRPEAALVLALVLLVPGRVQSWLWRDFTRGCRHLRAKRFEAAIECFLKFRERLKERPGLRHGVWLAWAIHTRDVGAMTSNNLGVASMLLGRAEDARRWFQEAIAADPLYAHPHAGLARLAAEANDLDAARAHATRAAELGYPPPVTPAGAA